MSKIYLVRHGRATSGWGLAEDPGLDELGRLQARTAAEKLVSKGPLPIITSPKTRARETAVPLAKIWEVVPAIEEHVGEISFTSENPANRVKWLKTIMAEHWQFLDRDLRQWREQVIKTLLSIATDTVVFSHYIAINAAVGFAIDDDRVVSFNPDNASITILKNDGGRLDLVKLGNEADTVVS